MPVESLGITRVVMSCISPVASPEQTAFITTIRPFRHAALAYAQNSCISYARELKITPKKCSQFVRGKRYENVRDSSLKQG